MPQVQAHRRARVQMDKVKRSHKGKDNDVYNKVEKQGQQTTLTPSINVRFIPPIIYTLLSDWTRLHKIDIPNAVVWEEESFGRVASHYLNRQYFVGLNPPLGTMLVALASLLSGYDGNFDFTMNEVYPDNVPYAPLRGKLATSGVLLVPLAWFTAVELGMSTWVCHLTTIMILCEVSFLMISRVISVDSIYLFFTFLTVFCFAKFHNQQSRSFSTGWWLWLTMTGVSIGCVTSVKFSGLSMAAVVGTYTIEDLWNRLCDAHLSVREKLKHWFARIMCLIILPILIFIFTFKIHFLILNHSGPGDQFMPSLFQANLIGNHLAKNLSPREITFGSKITLKNIGLPGTERFLHSHSQMYPGNIGSSEQQQISCFGYQDDDNHHWVVFPGWQCGDVDVQCDQDGGGGRDSDRFLKNGDLVRLNHYQTGSNLHAHNAFFASITKNNYEVSGYGNLTVGDVNDVWRVEVVDDVVSGKVKSREIVRSLSMRLRFRHNEIGCYLKATNEELPEWGFRQNEVSCDPKNNLKDKDTYWNVESHWNDRLPKENMKSLPKTSFMHDFWHLLTTMLTFKTTFNVLRVDTLISEFMHRYKPEASDALYLGIRMFKFAENRRGALLGTALIWWGSGLSLLVGLGTYWYYLLKIQMGLELATTTPPKDSQIVNPEIERWAHFKHVWRIAFYGWLFHFVPLLTTKKPAIYMNEYLPALYFSILMLSLMFDHFIFSSNSFPKSLRNPVLGAILGSLPLGFWVSWEMALTL